TGTAALIELARSYGSATSGTTKLVQPEHTIMFLSTDGGAFGALGAEHFAATSPYRDLVVSVINLDALGSHGPPRLELAGDEPRSPAATLVATAAARVFEQANEAPRRPRALSQLIDLALPFSLY